MGVIKIFSADSRDFADPYKQEKTIIVNSTPNPRNFTLVRKVIVNGYPILWVHYPDVNNYEGNKILMYEKNFNLERLKNRIDPHFFILGDSPVARFEPTERGMYMAVKLAKALL